MDWMPQVIGLSGPPAGWTSGYWSPLHGWVHIVAEFATWAAFFAIPVLLVYFVRRHPDVPYPRFFWLFGAFIFCCGTAFLVEALCFWWPLHALSAAFKILTALTSWATIIFMVPALPKALAMPGLQEMVGNLEQEVAERARQQLQLSAYAQELERRNSELDEFTYIASHDLQEPLRKLVSFSELLTQDLNRNDRAQAHRDLAYINDAARRMRKLIHDLLVLSRAGRSALARQPVMLQECVDAALRSLDMLVVEKNAVIHCPALPCVVADRTLLTQLYQNLIGNALKFMPAGRAPVIEVTVEDGADGLVFGVKDNGIGIARENHTQIFGAFKRLHGASEYEGNGIGLTICERVVTRHGGRIWVESEGQGAHFKFTLGQKEVAGCAPVQNDPRLSCSSRTIPGIRN